MIRWYRTYQARRARLRALAAANAPVRWDRLLGNEEWARLVSVKGWGRL